MRNKNIIHFKSVVFLYLQIVTTSLIINVVLFYVGKLFGGFSPELSTPNLQPLGLSNIVFSSIFFPIIGTIVFLIIFKTSKNPIRLFRIFGYGFIAIMFFGPIQLLDSKTIDVVLLELMHLVVGVQFIELFVRKFRISTSSSIDHLKK